MIVSPWAMGLGAAALVASGFYIMACHSFMRELMSDNQTLAYILERVKEQMEEDRED